MPKMKTKKMVVKRVRKSSRGRLLFTRPGRGHLLSSKSRGRKRHMRRAGRMCRGDEARISPMM
jgi:large subunit ribosomal protein L35